MYCSYSHASALISSILNAEIDLDDESENFALSLPYFALMCLVMAAPWSNGSSPGISRARARVKLLLYVSDTLRGFTICPFIIAVKASSSKSKQSVSVRGRPFSANTEWRNAGDERGVEKSPIERTLSTDCPGKNWVTSLAKWWIVSQEHSLSIGLEFLEV